MMNNRLALGTVQLGIPYGIANRQGQVSPDEAVKILGFAQANGINTLDTAIAYGESERRLGVIGVQGWRIVSKLPAAPEGCRQIAEWVESSVEESLQRLKVNKLYGLLLHRPNQLLERGGEELYRSLQKLKDNGLVQKIGVSIYDPAVLDLLIGEFSFDIVQAPFNILDRRLIETGYLSSLGENGTELHVRSVFLQGLLLMVSPDRPRKFDRWAALWSTWEEWLEHIGLSPLQACLRYVLSFSEISRVIVGVDSLSQLEEILHSAEGSMPKIPEGLKTDDTDLVNPAMWGTLA